MEQDSLNGIQSIDVHVNDIRADGTSVLANTHDPIGASSVMVEVSIEMDEGILDNPGFVSCDICKKEIRDLSKGAANCRIYT